MEKSRSVLVICTFSYLKLFHQLQKPWGPDELTLIKAENICEYNFFIVNHFVLKLALINLFTDNIFRKYFTWYGILGPNSRPFLIYEPTAIQGFY